MKTFKTYLSLFLVLISFSIFSQNYELGKVTVQELEEKEHPVEKDAEAAILYSKGESYIDYNETEGFFLITEVEMKIKIYTKEGYSWANKSVQYYIAENPTESVDFSKAITYNLENGKIEKIKLKSEGEFTEKLNKYWSIKKITMPNVKEGSIVEYKYKIRSPYFSNIPDWYFQNVIPVNYSKFSTRIPEYFGYKVNFKGFVTPKVTTKTSERTINYYDKEERRNQTASYQQSSFKYLEHSTSYETHMLQSMRDEEFVNNIKNYISSISHELTVIKYPNSPIKTLSNTWDDVVKTIYDNESFGNELRKTGYFEDDIAKLVEGVSSNKERIALIFNFVRNKMTWDNFRGYTCNEGVRAAYKNNTGNVAEINLMLTAMLRHAGLTANPVLLSTRDNGIALFPNRTSFNYVIAAVEIEEGVVLLDATEKIATPNILPIRDLNWEGRLIRKDGSSSSVSLLPSILSKDTKQIMAKLDGEGKISGKIRVQNTDYNAYNFRNSYLGLSKDSYIESIEKRYDNTQIEEYNVTNDKDLSKPVVEDISFTYDNLAEKIGSKMYFSPMLFFQLTENPFKLEKREYPVDFVYPQQDKYTFSITIPEGYQVESVPAPAAIAIDNSMVVFKYNIQTVGNAIQLTTTLDVNQSVIPSQYYEGLKDFFKNVVEKQAEKVVLVKI